MLGTQAGWETAAQQTIPDAPKAQPTLPDLRTVAPGQGTTSSSDDTGGSTSKLPAAPAPAAPATSAQRGQASVYGGDLPEGQGEKDIQTLLVHVDAVDVAFTVKDAKGRLVPGLEPRDIQV